MYWASVARNCGHWVPKVCDGFWAISWVSCFYDTSCCFYDTSCCFYDTLCCFYDTSCCFYVSGSAFIPCIIQKNSNSWLNKCCYCFFHRSGSKSLYFSSGVFGCHSMVFSMTSLMYSNRLMPFNLHEIAIEYRIAPRLAPSCEPKNIEFLLDSDMYLWILSM